MSALSYIMTNLASLLLSVLELLMFIRAVLSWLPIDEDNSLISTIYLVTEFVISPVRNVLDRFEFVASCPLDISFFVTFLLITFLQALVASL